ncbi:hypothetical protein SO802_006409 [Lithocarpus litseifolius]|uniref:Reverse transcriptase zinc-binding domain-containing protein n=1 Tax=Lithocarpus litseifolius TaxID=425828 RepID=A0AAW2DRF6_9ROSI
MRRIVVQDDVCEICKEASKMTGHVLWSCSKAKEAWECSKVNVCAARIGGVSFQGVMWQLLMVEGVDDEKAARVVTIAWTLWHNRNEMWNEGVRKSGQVLVQWAMEYLAEYGVAMELNEPAGPVVEHPVVWTPPRSGCFKINVDGATFSKQKDAGIGVLIRDDKGRVEAVLSRKIEAPLREILVCKMLFWRGIR